MVVLERVQLLPNAFCHREIDDLVLHSKSSGWTAGERAQQWNAGLPWLH